jgi:hypothetical protein
MSIRRSALTLGCAGLVLGSLAGCGSSTPTTTEVSGNCALEHDTYRLSPLSTDQLERVLGKGHYTLTGTVMTDEGKPKAQRLPLYGACSYTDGDKVKRLTIAVSSRNLLGNAYKASRKIQEQNPLAHPIDGIDGYVLTSDDPVNTGSRITTAVAFEKKYLVSVSVLKAGKGVNVSNAATTLVKQVVETFGKPVALQNDAGD